MKENQDWYSSKEMAEYLKISTSTLHRWIKAKAIPCHKIGQRWRFKRVEIEKWIVSGDSAKCM